MNYFHLGSSVLVRRVKFNIGRPGLKIRFPGADLGSLILSTLSSRSGQLENAELSDRF